MFRLTYATSNRINPRRVLSIDWYHSLAKSLSDFILALDSCLGLFPPIQLLSSNLISVFLLNFDQQKIRYSDARFPSVCYLSLNHQCKRYSILSLATYLFTAQLILLLLVDGCRWSIYLLVRVWSPLLRSCLLSPTRLLLFIKSQLFLPLISSLIPPFKQQR